MNGLLTVSIDIAIVNVAVDKFIIETESNSALITSVFSKFN